MIAPGNRITVLALFLLFLGIGRMFSLVTHDPVLGYANNYDMIRLQACHQIWPSVRTANVSVATPAAPIRRYTLDKHVDTPCFPSSELLFTGLGIEAGKLKNLLSDHRFISIKTIGFTKACFLALTALLASLYFYRRGLYGSLLANSLVTLLVLSDPGITLYLNTFYTEFSAVYFLYLALLGVVILADRQWQPGCLPVLLAGLAGLALSQPQHTALAMLTGTLLALFALGKRQWLTALLLVIAMPLILQTAWHITPQDGSIQRANRINMAGSLLGIADQPEQFLANLGVPADCKVLAGKNAYAAGIQKKNPCPELENVSKSTVLLALLKDPALLTHTLEQTLPQAKNWVFDRYGQVERGRTEPASRFQLTINDAIRLLPDDAFRWLAFATVLLPMLFLVGSSLRGHKNHDGCYFLLLLAALQWIVLGNALVTNGLVGIAKNMHLYAPLAMTSLLLTLIMIVRLVSHRQ